MLISDRMAGGPCRDLLALGDVHRIRHPVGYAGGEPAQLGLATGALWRLAKIGMAIPNFWFGILLILVFSVQLGWFDSGGLPLAGNAGALGRRWKALLLSLFDVALALVEEQDLPGTRGAVGDPGRRCDEDYVRTAPVPTV